MTQRLTVAQCFITSEVTLYKARFGIKLTLGLSPGSCGGKSRTVVCGYCNGWDGVFRA